MNILQAKKVIPFTYSSLEKTFEKETKAIELREENKWSQSLIKAKESGFN